MTGRGPGDLVVTPTGAWFLGRQLPCTIGRGGVTDDKREGDGATPGGVHHIIGTLYRPDRIRAPADWARPIARGLLWSDDPRDPHYNGPVRAPHRYSHERMRRADPLYDLVLLTDWNLPDARPGKGSAIFLHRWRKPGHPTEGCVAFDPGVLHWLARNAAPGTRLIVR